MPKLWKGPENADIFKKQYKFDVRIKIKRKLEWRQFRVNRVFKKKPFTIVECTITELQQKFVLKKHEKGDIFYCNYEIRATDKKNKKWHYRGYTLKPPFVIESDSNSDSENQTETDHKSRYRKKKTLTQYLPNDNQQTEFIPFPKDTFGKDNMKHIQKTLQNKLNSNEYNDKTNITIAINSISVWQRLGKITIPKYTQIMNEYEATLQNNKSQNIPPILDTNSNKNDTINIPENKRRKLTKQQNKLQKSKTKNDKTEGEHGCFCGESFKTEDKLKLHFNQKLLTKDEKHINCPFICPFPKLKGVSAEEIDGPKRFEHGKCELMFPNESMLQKHKTSNHAICYRKSRYLQDVICWNADCLKATVYAGISTKKGGYVAKCASCKKRSTTAVSKATLQANIRTQKEVDTIYPPIQAKEATKNESNAEVDAIDDDDIIPPIHETVKQHIQSNQFHKCPGCNLRIHIDDYKSHISLCL